MADVTVEPRSDPHPRWIAHMYAASSGEDHLGLASVSSDQILPMLSPTVNVLTIHPRYHSFYAFLLDEFWRRDLPRSPRAWVQFFRPRDFIYSIAMHLCDRDEHDLTGGVTGSRKTGPIAAREPSTFDTATDYIKERLGGYGLYYRSVLAGLGLVYPGGPRLPYPVDVPTEKGKELAAAFRRAIEHTAYYQQDFDLDEHSVPIERVREYAHAACLCQLRASDAEDGSLLRDSFLSEPPETAPARRATLRMLLDIADQTDGRPVDQDAFRQLIFYGTASNGARYQPRDDVAETHARWRLYQAREHYSFALTGMFVELCDWGLRGNGDLRPLSLDAVAEHVASSLDFDRLAHLLGTAAPGLDGTAGFGELLAWLTASAGATEETFDDRCGLAAALSEDALHRLTWRSYEPATLIAGGIVTLATLFLRFGRPERWISPAWSAVSRCGEDGRLSIHGFMRSLRDRVRHGSPTVSEVGHWLMTDYIIRQHQIVATAKLPDNTFRFEREGNRLRFYQHYNPLGFSNSRFYALSTTAHELGFCGSLGEAEHGLTEAGRDLLLAG
jgi:hypothetical protein